MFFNEEVTEHANVCAEAKFEESANSKEEKEQPSEDLQTFKNIADQQKLLSSKFMMSSDESVKFVIRRNNVVDDVTRKMNMFYKISVIKSVTAEFVGEEAIDDRDPLRELYTIFYDNGPRKLLYGPEKNYSFMHDQHRNEKCHFIFSESLLRMVCCKEYQDRIGFVSHWLSISYQMMLQLLQLLFNLLMFLFLK